MRNFNNYFQGSSGGGARPCECCSQPVTLDEFTPAIFGGGRFCSEKCSKLRTEGKHWNWLKENPEEYKKWMEWKHESQRGPNRDALGGDRTFPI